MDHASSNTIDMFSSEKKCPFSKIAGHETAIDLQPERNMLSFHLTMISIAREINQDTNTKEWFTCFKKLLNGKCQRQNSSDILDFWRSLQTSVKKLSKPKLEALLYSFLADILCEGIKRDGALSIFTIKDIFFKICSSFTAPFENDDATDTVEKENINSKGNKNPVSVFGLNSLCDGPMTDASNVASNNNSLCRKEPLLTVNPQSSNAEPELTHSEECKKVDEFSNHISGSSHSTSSSSLALQVNSEHLAKVKQNIGNIERFKVSSSSPEQSGEVTVETETASEVSRIVRDSLMGQGSASSEEHTTKKTVHPFAVMPRKERKTEERAKDKILNKASASTEECTDMGESKHACQGIQNKGGATKETEQDKKTKKVSQPSTASATSSTAELQVPSPSGQANRVEAERERNKSIESGKSSHEASAEKSRKPQKESKALPSSKNEIPNMDQKKICCPMAKEKKTQKLNTVMTETLPCCKEQSSMVNPEDLNEDTELKILESKQVDEVSLPSGAGTTSFTDELQVPGPSGEPNRIKTQKQKNGSLPSKMKSPESEKTTQEESAKKSRRPEKESKAMQPSKKEVPPLSDKTMLPHMAEQQKSPKENKVMKELSVPMQAPRNSDSPPILSNPVQEELTELKDEIYQLRGELFKTRKKLDKAEKYCCMLEEKVNNLEDNKENLMYQIQLYVKRLQGYEELYNSRTNSTL